MLGPRAAAATLRRHVRCQSGLPGKYQFIEPYRTKRLGLGVVHDPISNKGTAFTLSERDRLRIRGLVPPRQLSLATQAEKILHTVGSYADPLEKNLYLNSLQDRNETLFYRVLVDNLPQLAPYVYTPTVGQVCQRFGSYFRRARGMYFSSQDRGQMTEMVYNWPYEDVEIIVVTDGSRILGLGDLGANGMGIPIGKLALYVAAGGLHPSRVLPVMLDAGTDNEALRTDPWYLGMCHPRLRGDEYYSLIHEFMQAVHSRWPRCVVQFEDFSSDKAQTILEAYRYDHLSWNDDIQGTGAVALASLLAAIRTQGPAARLRDQRILIVGAGSAGLGVAQSLYEAMLHEGAEPDDARERFWVVDKDGLLGPERNREGLSPIQTFFTREHSGGLLHGPGPNSGLSSSASSQTGRYGQGLRDQTALLDAVKSVQPTILLGLTGRGRTFTEPVVREMAAHTARPIIFPLSNPTSHAECTAEEAYRWTDGRAIVASGSPFQPVLYKGKLLTPSQTNNMYIFPGVGLGLTTVRAKRVTDGMLYAAARALAEMVTEDQLNQGMVLPPISDIRKVSARVAAAVASSGIQDGIVQRMPPAGDLVRFMQSQMYEPIYQPIVSEVV